MGAALAVVAFSTTAIVRPVPPKSSCVASAVLSFILCAPVGYLISCCDRVARHTDCITKPVSALQVIQDVVGEFVGAQNALFESADHFKFTNSMRLHANITSSNGTISCMAHLAISALSCLADSTATNVSKRYCATSR